MWIFTSTSLLSFFVLPRDFLHLQSVSPGVDLDQARKAEEQQMLQDARQWLNRRKIEERKHPRTGATALHVAAAKGYCEVMRY